MLIMRSIRTWLMIRWFCTVVSYFSRKNLVTLFFVFSNGGFILAGIFLGFHHGFGVVTINVIPHLTIQSGRKVAQQWAIAWADTCRMRMMEEMEVAKFMLMIMDGCSWQGL